MGSHSVSWHKTHPTSVLWEYIAIITELQQLFFCNVLQLFICILLLPLSVVYTIMSKINVKDKPLIYMLLLQNMLHPSSVRVIKLWAGQAVHKQLILCWPLPNLHVNHYPVFPFVIQGHRIDRSIHGDVRRTCCLQKAPTSSSLMTCVRVNCEPIFKNFGWCILREIYNKDVYNPPYLVWFSFWNLNDIWLR